MQFLDYSCIAFWDGGANEPWDLFLVPVKSVEELACKSGRLSFKRLTTDQTIPSKVYVHFYFLLKEFPIPFQWQIKWTDKNEMFVLLMLLWKLFLNCLSDCCLLLWFTFWSLNCDAISRVLCMLEVKSILGCTNSLLIFKIEFCFVMHGKIYKPEGATCGETQCVPAVLKHFLLSFTGPICEECDFLEGNETRILPWPYILFGLCQVCYPWMYLLSSTVVEVAWMRPGY